MLSLVVLLSMSTAAAAPFTCSGPYVPPTDFDPTTGRPVILEFAVYTGAKSSPVEVVKTHAQDALVNRLCRADPSTCALLREKVKVWNHKVEGENQCVMAVVSADDLEMWRRALDPNLDDELKKALEPLLNTLDQAQPVKKSLLTGKVKKRSVVVVLAGVDDRGMPGGLRADWLLTRVKAVLTSINVDMKDPPKGWNGARPPKNVELIIKGQLIDRVDPKKQVPVLETTFSTIDADGRIRTGRPFTIPAALAPAPPRAVTAPPPMAGLAIHVEAPRGGSLCPGDYTQIHVRNEAPEELYVRVFNIDDDGEVLLLFPSETRADDRIPPNKSVSLSADGFTVDGAQGAREQYVAIAARGPEGLGKFRDMRGTCRFSKQDAKALRDATRIEAPYRVATGFTLLDDVRCGKLIPLPDAKLKAQALDDIPLCPSME